jgi:predicted Zn-dependent protease with MMP-like domain
MTQEKFEEIVKEGIGAIPERFLEKLDNVDIVIEDEPTPYQLSKLRARKSSIIFGLYEGVPQTKRGPYGQVLPDKITIFKKAIERMAHSEKEIKEMVKNTVWHEIAHHFGMDEKRVREAEHHHNLLKIKKSLK